MWVLFFVNKSLNLSGGPIVSVSRKRSAAVLRHQPCSSGHAACGRSDHSINTNIIMSLLFVYILNILVIICLNHTPQDR